MLTANDLLYKALDFDGFWNSSKKIRNSEPSKARKLQLDILLNTFQINRKGAKNVSQTPFRDVPKNNTVEMYYSISPGNRSFDRKSYIKQLTDLRYLSTGEFIADMEWDKYEKVLEKIVPGIKQIFPTEMENIQINSINLVRVFENLYSFRRMIYSTLETNFHRGWKTDFLISDAFSDHLKDISIEKMPVHFREIDEVLCILIDPEKRSFSETEINYPEFDMKAIDQKWKDETHLKNSNDDKN